MGSSLEKPTKCPLCYESTGNPVTLKCNHRFCQRCIEDLWSVTPDGPYRCPEWRCPTEYQTLPFDSSLVRPSTNKRRARSHSSAGTSSNGDQNTSDSLLRRPSLTSRLLGKRKAGTPVAEQPDPKRVTVEASNGAGDASTSSSATPAEPLDVERDVQPESAEPNEGGLSMSSDDISGNKAVPECDMAPDPPVQSPVVVTLDDSDSADEVDICDAALLETPAKDEEVSEIHTTPTKPTSPTKSDSFGSTTSGKDKSPGQRISMSPLLSSPQSAAASGSSSHSGHFPRLQSNSTRPVHCHYCPKTVSKSAVKTCLVCGASMCSEHLRPHLDSPVFQNHTLVPATEDISVWRCQDHQEINRIYCRQCGVCVCTVCTLIGAHRGHICISIREAERELRGTLNEEIKQLQKTEKEVKDKVTELTQKKETFKGVLSEARAGVQQQYLAIKEALEQEELSALQCVTREERRVLCGLEDKLSHLQSSLLSVQQGLYTLEGLSDARGDRHIQDQAFIMEYSKIAQLASVVGNCVEQFEAPEEVDQARLKCLERWTEKRLDAVVITVPGKDRDLYCLLYGIVPILDPDTAHPKLQLSDNNRKVTYSDVQQAYREHEARFSSFPQVLACCVLEHGRYYWEVNVSVEDGRWKVGLCEAQTERKGQKDASRLGFNSSSWCLACDKRRVEALHNKVSVPVDADGLKRVGVFLDFEEGVLSFFNVTPGGSLALIHSYKHKFTGRLHPALSVSKTHLTICNLFQS
ncbi:uncharacterized protein V6R79_011062 [Siganus canaliculatus]